MAAAPPSVKVKVQHLKNVYEVDIDTKESPASFSAQLYSLTGVPESRQKLVGIPGVRTGLLDSWEKMRIKDGTKIMLIGTADSVPTPSAAAAATTTTTDDDEGKSAAGAATGPMPPGLVNLGNTCYMSATLQALRAVPELRDALAAYQPPASGGGDPEAALVAAMRDLVAKLEAAPGGDAGPELPPVVPAGFLVLLRRVFPQFDQRSPEGLPMQQDADECFVDLLNVLMRKLDGSNGAVSRAFDGEFAVTTAPTGAGAAAAEAAGAVAETTREQFTRLSCHIGVKDKPSFLIDGLRGSLRETLVKRLPSGSDAEFQRTKLISRMPGLLSVSFVRFFWKAEEKVKAKINWPVDFPFVLDVYSLCTPELQRELNERREEMKRRSDMELEEETKAILERAGAGPRSALQPSQSAAGSTFVLDANVPRVTGCATGLYDLFAIVTHKGVAADSGHYVAWVRVGARWLCFDDSDVFPVTDEDIRRLTGKGGSMHHIAYLTLYRARNL